MAKTSRTTTTKKASSSATFAGEETKLKELFIEELRDIYWAEKHLVKALPKMRKACTSQELANAFEDHLAVTEGQVGRVEQVFELLDMAPRAKSAKPWKVWLKRRKV